jgi:hypothetical protein
VPAENGHGHRRPDPLQQRYLDQGCVVVVVCAHTLQLSGWYTYAARRPRSSRVFLLRIYVTRQRAVQTNRVGGRSGVRDGISSDFLSCSPVGPYNPTPSCDFPYVLIICFLHFERTNLRRRNVHLVLGTITFLNPSGVNNDDIKKHFNRSVLIISVRHDSAPVLSGRA